VALVTAPLRLSLAGGGTDLPEHYRRAGCHLLAVTVTRRVRVQVTASRAGVTVSVPGGRWRAGVVDDLPPSLVRCALEHYRLRSGVAVTIASDLPPGTGMGGSGAMLVALVTALGDHLGARVNWDAAARTAFQIERRRAGRPVGQQDHWVSAHGGLVRLRIDRAGRARATGEPELFARVRELLDHELTLFETPLRRAADPVLSEQAARLGRAAPARAMGRIAAQVPVLEHALGSGSLDEVGALLDRHWRAKRAANPAVTSPQIDHWYAVARRAGARGGKLVGAGGGGYLLLAVPVPAAEAVERALRAEGVRRVSIGADPDGVRLHRR
jgi:D-glycero-alpha-D-manno-heptose-7-phosphate kinase